MTDQGLAHDGRFSGQVAIVTGSARGIGRATATRLASEGATVVINDIDEPGIADAIASMAGLSGRAVPGPADVTSEDEINALAAQIIAEHGRIDIVVNNAGGMKPGSRWSTVQDTTLADWNDFLALNLTSAFLLSRAALPSMLANGFGRIVCVSSISGEYGQHTGSAYAAAKAGLPAFVASLAKEVGARGIGVNGIIVGNAPHPTRTPERQALLDGWVHLGRVGAYEEFAAAIAFLCSSDASYLSGTMMPIDGGFHRFNLL
jgi:NAD(P)-dependent dehydrogenase (short-subunit alcohol dehydrogenase family)